MISMPDSTKEQYKAFERELQVYGNLYLAKKRLSNNLFNPFATRTNSSSSVSSTVDDVNERISVSIASSLGTSSGRTVITLNLKANTDYTITFKYTRTNTTNYSTLGVRPTTSGGTFLSPVIQTNEMTGTGIYTFNSGSYTTAYLWLYAKASSTDIAVDDTITYSEIMMNEGTTALSFEYYGKYIYDYATFPLTEENNAKILSFNINEKCDVYYTSLPYNTMTIEVDNEKGYFTDYDPDSIVNKLNSDCYIDLFIKINDDDYYKIMKMNFDEISYSDYEKAKLSFVSSIARLKNLPLRDRRNEDFTTTSWGRARIKIWLASNYDITYVYPGSNISTLNTTSQKITSVENVILYSGTDNSSIENAVITTNDTEDRIALRNWKSTADESITKNYELEKPLLKRENTYDGYKNTYNWNGKFAQSSETYTRVINGTLSSVKETLVIRDNNYRLKDLTINDITIMGGPTLEIDTYSSNSYIVILKLSGNLGDEYTITINKENITKKISETLTTNVIGNTSENAKVLVSMENSPLQLNYFNLILNEKKIKSYIEVKMLGLPYLELGDAVEIETDNANVLTTISEIDMDFDGGLTMTIKGYELGWDALFPSDTLYPSDDLYPNTPIS